MRLGFSYIRYRRFRVLFPLFLFFVSCSRSLEPGLYQVAEGFLRVGVDSLGNETALLYRNGGGLWADTLTVDLKTDTYQMKPYHAPEFHRFPMRELYREPVYGVEETRDIVYGRVLRGEEGERMDLTLDLYQPGNDKADSRPLLVMFRGGGFRGGDMRDSCLVEWCRYYASLGYVVSSVDYRQAESRRFEDTEDALFKSLKDANAAVRFLLRRDSLLIHSGRIFAGGADAGAITALNLAYMREENMPEIIREEEDTTIVIPPSLLRGFDVRAVANLWGAVPDTTILHNAKIPVISFHSREDRVVPFGAGFPFEEPDEEEERGFFRSAWEVLISIFFSERHPFREMYGSGIIHRILKGRGVSSELHAYDGDRHNLFIREDGSIDYPLFDEIKEQTAAFFASKMVIAPVSLHQDPEDPQLFVIDRTEVETCLWNVDGGALLGTGEDTARILFFPDASEHAVSVSGEYASGLTFYERVVF